MGVDVKIFKRTPREDVTYFGWYGLFGGITDAICAPINEVEDFNKRIRNPAGLGVQGGGPGSADLLRQH